MLTAHAGEEEGASCVDMCLEVLQVDRIDHGVRCMEGECHAVPNLAYIELHLFKWLMAAAFS